MVFVGAGWTSGFSQGTTVQDVARPSTLAEINVLVKQALEDLLGRQEIPDSGLFRRATRIAIREDMRRSGFRLGPEALPTWAGYEFFLLSGKAAQADADRSRQNVHFIAVDTPVITANEAMLRVGVDLVVPSDPQTVVLCCCTGHGLFQRSDGRWKFVKWLSRVCS
jgi:hypothetical protein